MAWVLTRGLTTWRNEINAAAPNRDKTSDGSIGDALHATGTSGHNNENSGHAEYNDYDGKDEVRAIDVDKDLNRAPFTMETLIQWLVTKGRNGDYLPFRYFIYNGRIWRKSTGWATQTYTGSNPHDHHAHFSGDYTQTADEWNGSLGLFNFVKSITGEDVALDTADKSYLDGKFDFQNDKANIIVDKVDAARTKLDEAISQLATQANLIAAQTKLTPYETGGGSGSPIGNAILNAGFPRRPGDQRTQVWLNIQNLQLSLDTVTQLVTQGFSDDAARDAADAARDAALSATLDQMVALLQAAGNQVMTDAQFAELKQSILEKVVEAGQDAADQSNAKLNQVIEALDNAGEALANIDGVPTEPQP